MNNNHNAFAGNCTLGVGDSTDRALPERVNLLTQSQSYRQDPSSPHLAFSKLSLDNGSDTSKFATVGVRKVVMGKFHTAVVTREAKGNLSLTGFGSHGR